MGKKVTGWKTKGMNRDWSVSAFNYEFAFENVNLRLSTNENNTLMSWVNEKGPLAISITIDVDPWETEDKQDPSSSIVGIPIGTAIINHKLVLFTTAKNTARPDYIYVLWYSNEEKTQMSGKILYNGNINFNAEHPLETLVSYEAEHIQKVYWTDGFNQPRMINIAADIDKLDRWNNSGESEDFFFDFVPSIHLVETVTVEKYSTSGGLFAPGVIQYCISYINKYGQQSNVVWVSSLYYLADSDRGASPEEKVSSSFKITIQNADTDFDYVRLYSIQRTSLNATPSVKHIVDITIDGNTLSYVDNGTTGYTMDPMELQYIGGKEVTALTMADKDQTLFLGNLTQPNTLVTSIQDYFNDVRGTAAEPSILFKNDGQKKVMTLDQTTGIYSHTNTLKKSLREITTFKGGDKYRFGFQLQKRTGEWSEPIFIDDKVNTLYPSTSIHSNNVNLVYAQTTLDISDFADQHFYSIYKKIRPVIVYPNIADRNVLCQGVLNPTVFNALDRIDKSPYAQASWYFRPYMANGDGSVNPYTPTAPTVVTTAYTEGTTITVPVYFSSRNLTTYVYVLIATIADGSVNLNLDRGYIRVAHTIETHLPNGEENTEDKFDTYYYWGAVQLTDTRKYAFFATSPWPEPGNTINYLYNTGGEANYNAQFSEDYYVRHTYAYADGVGPEEVEENPYLIYSGMEADEQHIFYYRQPENAAPSTYSFQFVAGSILYEVSFPKVESSYRVITRNTSGSELAYTHYSSLLNAGGTNSVGPRDKEATQVEIQGSYGVLQNPYSTYNSNSRFPSNTQFFIDQSIVTLNSPDLEFDTDVQTYSKEGLKLRVVGAIPITANVSAHSITTSSAMLERNHNNDANKNKTFGAGELNENVVHNNIDINAGKRLVADYLWSDVLVRSDSKSEDKIKTDGPNYKFLIYPWHRKGSLNNDVRTADQAASLLQTKKESNLLFSINTEYIASPISFENISSQFILTENDQVMNYRLPRQKDTSSEINYYSNIDKVLYNENGYSILTQEIIDNAQDISNATSPVSMKYKSTTHALLALNAATGSGDIPLLPYGRWPGLNVGIWLHPVGVGGNAFWGDTGMFFTQSWVDMSNLFSYNTENQRYNFLWIGELYKEPLEPFGGTSPEAVKNNRWQVAGEAVTLPEIDDNNQLVSLYWTDGDTYYQRYDCLKTYAFTPEDNNQIVEILSFMCETHTNIDGRYDKNRGQIQNYDMSPRIFNILNPVYSQQDNFFTFKKTNTEGLTELTYPNHLYYSKTKQSGADVDLWTNITLATTLELDGDKGQITSINRLNNNLIAFQNTGIAHILYNENVQISSTEGVPIEIANSGKVQGKRYLSDTIGCSNKWSISTTPSGIYFMDSNDKSIFVFNGQLNNLSLNGFNVWSKKNIPSSEVLWNPDSFENFVSYYDKQNQDILFINKDTTLAFSERVNAFTSFYSYENTPYFCNLDDTGIWVKSGTLSTGLYKHNAGDYCNFFGVNKPYSMTLVGNPEPQIDKIFTNLEFRANIDGDGTNSLGNFTPSLPFDSLETWNEYQHGVASLDYRNGRTSALHHQSNGTASLNRKFRIWRCDIPRDNAQLSMDTGKNITRFKAHPIDRMRNPWLYLKLQKNAATGTSVLDRTEIHDIVMTYFS